MAWFLLELPKALNRKNKVHAVVLEAASADDAKAIASARSEGDSDWTSATVTTLSANLKADFAGNRYRARIFAPGATTPKFEASYTAVASDGAAQVAAALRDGLNGRPVVAAIADDGGVFTDETVAANQDTAGDMTLLPAVPADGDAYLFGFNSLFARLFMHVATAGVGTYTMAWEYWNGSAWTALAGVTDDTTSFKTVGRNEVKWTLPTDWQPRVVGTSKSLFFVRAVKQAGTVTTVPNGTRVFCGPGTNASSSGASLTAAQIAENIGDHTLLVDGFVEGSALPSNAILVGAITHQGAQAAVLSVSFNTPTPIPIVKLEASSPEI